MGFNKRYVSLDNIKNFVDNGHPVCKIFEVDALFFMDEKSHEIYKLCLEGVNDTELKKIIKNETELRNQ